MYKILIVEDEPAIALALQDDLELDGYSVSVVTDGNEAMSIALEAQFDLILLDVMLPGKNGYDICRELRRKKPRVAIIMLTAKSHEAEKILGLELGADDYITKPFSPLELRARIKALLRRSDSGNPAQLEVGPVRIDHDRMQVVCNGRNVELTRLEFRILAALMQRPGHVLSRDSLLDLVWGENVIVSDRAIDTHVANIRKKLESDVIESVRGLGYRFID